MSGGLMRSLLQTFSSLQSRPLEVLTWHSSLLGKPVPSLKFMVCELKVRCQKPFRISMDNVELHLVYFLIMLKLKLPKLLKTFSSYMELGKCNPKQIINIKTILKGG